MMNIFESCGARWSYESVYGCILIILNVLMQIHLLLEGDFIIQVCGSCSDGRFYRFFKHHFKKSARSRDGLRFVRRPLSGRTGGSWVFEGKAPNAQAQCCAVFFCKWCTRIMVCLSMPWIWSTRIFVLICKLIDFVQVFWLFRLDMCIQVVLIDSLWRIWSRTYRSLPFCWVHICVVHSHFRKPTQVACVFFAAGFL